MDSDKEEGAASPDISTASDDIKFKIRTKGQLKLTIYQNEGRLTIHVIEGRNISPKLKGTSNSYVQVALLPNSTNKDVSQTPIVWGNVNPMYDKKFHYASSEYESKKRLFVSMWNRADINSEELLGCMSFGLKNVTSSPKNLDGWYHLLSNSLGQKKHFKVITKKESSDNNNVSLTAKPLPAQSFEKEGYDLKTVLVARGPDGYGFTIRGSRPTTIGTISEGYPAKSSGLQRGDAIVRVNSEDADQLTPERIAQLIKNSDGFVVLQVMRKHSTAQISSSASYGSSARPDQFSSLQRPRRSTQNERPHSAVYQTGSALDYPCPSIPQTSSPNNVTYQNLENTYQSITSITPTTPSKSSVTVRHSTPTKHSTPNKHSTPTKQDGISSPSAPMNTASMMSTFSTTLCDYLQGDLDKENHQTAVKRVSANDESTPVARRRAVERLRERRVPFSPVVCTPVGGAVLALRNDLPNALPYRGHEVTLKKRTSGALVSSSSAVSSSAGSGIVPPNSSGYGSDGERFHDDMDLEVFSEHGVTLECLSTVEAGKTVDVSTALSPTPEYVLLSIEEEFVNQMQRGIQRFSRPLRHNILSANEHARLFQNVEKIVAISEYLVLEVESLIERTDNVASQPLTSSVSNLSRILDAKLSVIVDAHRKYCAGLASAEALLDDLHKLGTFRRFIARQNDDVMGIRDFIYKPKLHIENLLSTLETWLTKLDENSDLAPKLHSLSHELRSVCTDQVNTIPSIPVESTRTQVPADPMRRCSSTDSVSRMSLTSNTGTTSRISSVTSCSVDSEVAELQSRLFFPSYIKTFHVASASRHLIYSGEILLLRGATWCKTWMLLFSDLVLFTQELTPAGALQLSVIEQPMYLNTISRSQFNCRHECEFLIMTEQKVEGGEDCNNNTAPEGAIVSRCYDLQAPSVEQKWTWKYLLEQRVNICRSDNELLIGSGSDVII